MTLACGLAGLVLATAGCRIEMFDQPRGKALRGSEIYPDSAMARPQVKGTVVRNPNWTNSTTSFAEATGGVSTSDGTDAGTNDSAKTLAGAFASDGVDYDKNGRNPLPITRELVARGQDRFNIFCSPCHGRTGEANGMIVQRGFPAPQTYHSDRLRGMPDGYFYDVITNGFGRMYSYATRIVPEDRWAIVAYIRALQFSRNATLQDVPAQDRNKLEGAAQ